MARDSEQLLFHMGIPRSRQRLGIGRQRQWDACTKLALFALLPWLCWWRYGGDFSELPKRKLSRASKLFGALWGSGFSTSQGRDARSLGAVIARLDAMQMTLVLCAGAV